jgi:hypothetical protein
MGDKGGQRVVKVCTTMCPKGLVRDATMPLFAIDDSEEPDNPVGGIIRFTGGNALCTILLSLPRLPLGKRPYGEMLAGES